MFAVKPGRSLKSKVFGTAMLFVVFLALITVGCSNRFNQIRAEKYVKSAELKIASGDYLDKNNESPRQALRALGVPGY